MSALAPGGTRKTVTAGAIAVAIASTAHAVLAARGEWITNDKKLIDNAGLRHADAALEGLTADPRCLGGAVDTAERLITKAVAPFAAQGIRQG